MKEKISSSNATAGQAYQHHAYLSFAAQTRGLVTLRGRVQSKHWLNVLLSISTLIYFAYARTGLAQCREVCDGDSNVGFGAVLFHLQAGTSYNTALGELAQQSNETGNGNTAVGAFALDDNTAGSDNTAVGVRALYQNTASENTAVGALALESNSTGQYNSGFGYSALSQNNGNDNTASGFGALQNNSAGSANTATGSQALFSNTTGNNNTSSGFNSLVFNTGGSNNVADGVNALQANTTGAFNTALGTNALYSTSTANYNVAVGGAALYHNTGSNNTGVGVNALLNNTSGINNIAIGTNAGQNLSTGNNNIDLGANVVGKTAETNTIRLGIQGTQKATFIAGISGTAVTGAQVVVTSAGKLGVASSSAQFKQAIKPMDKTSEAILSLKPVTFNYKEEIDPDATPQFGLIAEEVEKVTPDLVIYDQQGKPFTVRYEAVNAMLLNEFLKQHRKVEEQEARLTKQQKEIEALKTSLQRR